MPTASGWHRKRRDTPAERARNAQYASAEHRAMRRQLQREVDAGRGFCWRCGTRIPPGAAWHTGHDDNDRSQYRGIECPDCNQRTAARKGARKRNATARATTVRL